MTALGITGTVSISSAAFGPSELVNPSHCQEASATYPRGEDQMYNKPRSPPSHHCPPAHSEAFPLSEVSLPSITPSSSRVSPHPKALSAAVSRSSDTVSTAHTVSSTSKGTGEKQEKPTNRTIPIRDLRQRLKRNMQKLLGITRKPETFWRRCKT